MQDELERVLPEEQRVNTPDIKDVEEIVREATSGGGGGGSSNLYLHKLDFDYDQGGEEGHCLLNIITNDDTPITFDTLIEKAVNYLFEENFAGTKRYHFRMPGSLIDKGAFYGICQLFIEVNGSAHTLYVKGLKIGSAEIQILVPTSYVPVTDDEAVNAFEYLSRVEGIIPAIESAHAIEYARKLAPTMSKDQIIVVNISGRGDKDVYSIAKYRGVKLDEE